MMSKSPNPIASSFAYDPLPNASTYFRLLEILEGDFDQNVVCELTTWKIEDAPPYHAISYTWGSVDSSTKTIVVNKKKMEVRHNCKYVLQQAFASKRSKYYWCDAICINQNYLDEKTLQVANFASLYQRAAHVHVCVGEKTEDSKLLFDFMRSRRALLDNILEHTKCEELKNKTLLQLSGEIPFETTPPLKKRLLERCKRALPSQWKTKHGDDCNATMFPQLDAQLAASKELSSQVKQVGWSGTVSIDGRIVWLRCALSDRDPSGKDEPLKNISAVIHRYAQPRRDKIMRIFLRFMQRPYFSRLWILQELQLGKSKSIHCGADIMPFEYFFAIYQLIKVWQQDLLAQGWTGRTMHWMNARSGFSIEATKASTELHRLGNQLGCLNLGMFEGLTLAPAILLKAVQHFNCTDSRDKIYGTLALTDWTRNIPADLLLEPDYQKESFEIAVEVMTCLLLHLDIMTLLTESYQYLPRARHIRGLLMYTNDQTSFQNAMLNRQKPYDSKTCSQPVMQAQWPDVDWIAFYIYPFDTGVRFAGKVYHRPRPKGSLAELVNSHGELLAYAPAGTRDGDWLSINVWWWEPGNETDEINGLIVRSCPDLRNIILGMTCPIKHKPQNRSNRWRNWEHPAGFKFGIAEAKFFQFRWNAEDLLLYEWRVAHMKTWWADSLGDEANDEIVRWCMQRVCITEKSSYAFGPHDSLGEAPLMITDGYGFNTLRHASIRAELEEQARKEAAQKEKKA